MPHMPKAHSLHIPQENSPRECLRPQIDTWLSTLFSRPVSTPAHVSIPLLRLADP